MFNIDQATAYAARYGISRGDPESALRNGEIDCGTLPRGGWTVDTASLDAWCQAHA